jgi:hypothetical protein
MSKVAITLHDALSTQGIAQPIEPVQHTLHLRLVVAAIGSLAQH